MKMNDDFLCAWDFIENTNKSVFLTGKAGTGKTTFLRYVSENTSKNHMIVAPTGVAAIQAQGVTIHSFFQLPLAPYVPGTKFQHNFNFRKDKRNLLKLLDLLIIDEISMVRADTLDAIDLLLRRYKNSKRPFGGVQLLMIGDLYQLSPVVTAREEALLSPYYNNVYFFSSKALQQIDYTTLELSTIYRQQDIAFIALLNHIREGVISSEDIAKLNKRYIPNFNPRQIQGYITLTTHNDKANNYNDTCLAEIKAPTFTYDACIEGVFPSSDYPTPATLCLKKGAQVMFLNNDSEGEYYNGKIGIIDELSDENISVRCTEGGKERSINVKKCTWSNVKYKINAKTNEIETETIGTFEQYPLRLAWAITIHKSQGLTFDKVGLDLQFAFATGQVYVALSRCRNLEGIVLSSPITENSIKIDQQVCTYSQTQIEIAKTKIASLSIFKEEYHRTLLEQTFDLSELIASHHALYRFVVESFTKHTQLGLLYKTSNDELSKRLKDIATQWKQVIFSTNYTTLNSPDFVARVKRGAAYFYEQLSDLLDKDIKKAQELTHNNQEQQKRFENIIDELCLVWGIKRILLLEFSQHDFTVRNYQLAWRKALLLFSKDSNGSQQQSQSAKKKQKTKLQSKPMTAAITYEMLLAGKSVEEIAASRDLTIKTIVNHLIIYIRKGVLKAADLIGETKVNYIKSIIQTIGEKPRISEIKDKAADEISYEDIYITVAENNEEDE